MEYFQKYCLMNKYQSFNPNQKYKRLHFQLRTFWDPIRFFDIQFRSKILKIINIKCILNIQ